MPTELELCAVSAVVGALLGGIVTFTVTHKIDGATLAHEQAAHASEIARINATAAKQLADAIAKQQATEGKIATLTDQYQQEVANHAKDNLDYRAKLLSGTQRIRVRVNAGSCASTNGEGTGTASGTNDAFTFELPPATAANVVAIADEADDTARKLAALQSYVRELQNDGYISK